MGLAAPTAMTLLAAIGMLIVTIIWLELLRRATRTGLRVAVAR